MYAVHEVGLERSRKSVDQLGVAVSRVLFLGSPEEEALKLDEITKHRNIGCVKIPRDGGIWAAAALPDLPSVVGRERSIP